MCDVSNWKPTSARCQTDHAAGDRHGKQGVRSLQIGAGVVRRRACDHEADDHTGKGIEQPEALSRIDRAKADY